MEPRRRAFTGGGQATLLRRLSLDLTGLPPTLADLDAFLAEENDTAYENAVDRLLESSHFGEKWHAIGWTWPGIPTATVPPGTTSGPMLALSPLGHPSPE